MRLAEDGIREVVIATIVLGGAAWLVGRLCWPAAIVPVVVWVFVLAFFRDPRRVASFQPGQYCAPADGKLTEVARLDHHDRIGGPAVRFGIFLSIFDVHANRSPCAGRVELIDYTPGSFLDARDPESSHRNEANTLVIHPVPPLVGPIVVRQVAGKLARRIVCHVGRGDDLRIGQRFGMIKFGSRTELILPAGENLDIPVGVGQKVRAGLTVLAIQRPGQRVGARDAHRCEVEQPV
jgi:phosphatidylserine decarboxylase